MRGYRCESSPHCRSDADLLIWLCEPLRNRSDEQNGANVWRFLCGGLEIAPFTVTIEHNCSVVLCAISVQTDCSTKILRPLIFYCRRPSNIQLIVDSPTLPGIGDRSFR